MSADSIRGRRILITGGTGFLGRHLAATLRDGNEVVLGARNNKQNAEARAATGCEVVPLDVTNIESVRDAFVEFEPQLIIHAAATKYVDLAERMPMECVDVNVLGSQNVARVAMERGAGGVVGISTDKASPPVRNTYGLSKALMERMYCGLDGKSATAFTCVRYGNVAWSTGSVLPVWKGMHERDGVIGTTGPEMRRFFFTVGDAVRLVLVAVAALEEVRGGVLARPMKAALIEDLLETWVAVRGGRWERIEGRPGERDDEFLIGELELPYARFVDVDPEPHILIDYGRKAEEPFPAVISSASAERLSAAEMEALIELGG